MSLIHRLKNEHDVIINQADKGSSIVLLVRNKCVEEAHKHLADTETYTRLEQDIANTTKKTIQVKLDRLHETGLLTNRQYKYCYPPETHRTSLIYFLIKIHKNPHAYRPICLCTNSITTNLSSFLDHWFTSRCSTTHLHQRQHTPHPNIGKQKI